MTVRPPGRWPTRPETPADVATIRRITLAAFDTPAEADLVDALRADRTAWLGPEFSVVAVTADGRAVGHALLTRCHVGTTPALGLAPCSVLPDHQRTGAGSAAIRAVLDTAHDRGEATVVVLGHPDYYPRFGFVRASTFGIRAPIDVPDDAFMVLPLGTDDPPSGVVDYPEPFGI